MLTESHGKWWGDENYSNNKRVSKQGYFFSLHLRTFLDTEPFGPDCCACCRLSEIWYFEQYKLFIIVGGIVIIDWPGSTELIIICGSGTSLTMVRHLSFQQLFYSKNTRVCLHVHILIDLLFSTFLHSLPVIIAIAAESLKNSSTNLCQMENGKVFFCLKTLPLVLCW